MSWAQCPGQALDLTSESKTVQDRESFDRVNHTDFLARVVLTSVSGVLMTPGPIYVSALEVEQYQFVE